ncbi:alpha-galactosidase [Fundicoccus sp. Sow4_H7]|uniref:alpha-galactosidase n=1 Tax=Fundicoccus sp. Sow4_H7 TaxID=3438784 RepID=UPI003F92FE88
MTIQIKDSLFFIHSKGFSLILEQYHDYLMVRHIGKNVTSYNNSNRLINKDHAFSPAPYADDRTFSMDTQRQILGQQGLGDFRLASIVIANKKNQLSDFKYKSYRIYDGVPEEKPLPFPYDLNQQTQTIVFELVDNVLDLTLEIHFTVYEESSTISTYRKLINHSNERLMIKKFDSFMIDLEPHDYTSITFQGAYGREKEMVRSKINQGIHSIASNRGASGHGQTPSIILGEKDVNDSYGECLAIQLMYSGNFHATVQKNQLRELRASIGFEPSVFGWELSPQDSFATPATIINFSSQGLNHLSHVSHQFILDHIVRPEYARQERPILINNWEATYFDFNFDKLTDLADKAQNLGIELFVLDDGWFGNRFDDNRALGDWTVNEEKLSHSLDHLIEEVHGRGMKFGLWFEPEMISVDSDLFRQHPDWAIQVADRPHTYSRNQLVLDLSKPEVADYIKETLSHYLSTYKIDYVKWDMNGNITNVGSYNNLKENLMLPHKYMLALYDIFDYLTNKFPDVLFESCAGGGGRNDLGIMRYFPQVWTSDNTDAISRIQLQNSMTFLYPTITMGSHVSAVPNHQTGRITPLETRNHMAMSGNLGYELDLTQLSDSELSEIKENIALYKSIRPIIQLGERTRLETVHPTNEFAYQFIGDEGVVVTYIKVLSDVEFTESVVRLKDLEKDALYEVDGDIYSGEELMVLGFVIPVKQEDFYSKQIILKKVEEK